MIQPKIFLKSSIIVLFIGFFPIEKAVSQDRNKIDSILIKIKTVKSDTTKIKLLLKLGNEYKNTIPDTALYYYNIALVVAIKENNNKYIGFSLRNIGIYYSKHGSYDKAIEYYMKAFSVFEKLNKNNDKAGCLENIGVVYRQQGCFDKAIDYLMKALKVFEFSEDKKGMADCYCNIGNVNYDQHNYENAIEYYTKSLKISLDINYKINISNIYNNIGNVYHRQGSNNKAIDFYLKSLKIDEEAGDKYGMSFDYGNIGNVYSDMGVLDKALEYYDIALKMSKKVDDTQTLSGLYCCLSELNIKLKNYNDAVSCAENGINIAKKIGNLPMQGANYERLSIAYDSLHNYKKVSQYQKLLMGIVDSIFNENKIKQITEIQTKYETEKKESQIKILQKDKVIQAAQISREKLIKNILMAGIVLMLLLIFGIFFYVRVLRIKEKIATEKKIIELEQKSLLLQMNPHFIFNSLNSIRSQMLINLNAAREYLAKFARLMRLILENSSETFVIMSNELDIINNYLALEQQRLSNFDYKVIIDEAITSDNIEIPPMLIQPHIENAIIHGISNKQERGNIEVRFNKLLDNTIQCVIRDDGVGRKKSAEMEINKETIHKSLALEITRERLKLMNKGKKENISIKIDDIEDNQQQALGTKVTIRMPYRLI